MDEKKTFPKDLKGGRREGLCIFTLYQFPGSIQYTNTFPRIPEQEPEEQNLLSLELSRNLSSTAGLEFISVNNPIMLFSLYKD